MNCIFCHTYTEYGQCRGRCRVSFTYDTSAKEIFAIHFIQDADYFITIEVTKNRIDFHKRNLAVGNPILTINHLEFIHPGNVAHYINRFKKLVLLS